MSSNLEKLTALCAPLKAPEGRETAMAIMQVLGTYAMLLDAYEHDQTEPLANDFAASKGFLAMVDGLEYLITIGIDGGLERDTLEAAVKLLKRLGVGSAS
jgi:hypothetical protein